jgi:hypothetical protein
MLPPGDPFGFAVAGVGNIGEPGRDDPGELLPNESADEVERSGFSDMTPEGLDGAICGSCQSIYVYPVGCARNVEAVA